MSGPAADFAGRPGTALVVGGTGGLGLAVVRMLARRGSHVALTYLNRKAAAEAAVSAARQWGVRASAHELDLAYPDAAAEVAATVAEAYGGLHTLVYAAGAPVRLGHLAAVAPETMGAQLSSDAAGFFAAVQPALPHLRHHQGSIVAVTSAATTRHTPRTGLSAVPKAAVEALVRALAVEEGRFGVRVNAVGPGMLTDATTGRLISSGALSAAELDAGRARIPLARFGTATDVAEAVCFLASHRAAYISGQKLDVDGGYGV